MDTLSASDIAHKAAMNWPVFTSCCTAVCSLLGCLPRRTVAGPRNTTSGRVDHSNLFSVVIVIICHLTRGEGAIPAPILLPPPLVSMILSPLYWYPFVVLIALYWWPLYLLIFSSSIGHLNFIFCKEQDRVSWPFFLLGFLFVIAL